MWKMVDAVGCKASGSLTPDARVLRRAEVREGATGQASVVDTSERLSSQAAAQASGYVGVVHEPCGQTHGHAGIGNVTTVLAMAEALGPSVRQVIEVVTAGIEISCRASSTFYPIMKRYGYVALVAVDPANSTGAAAAVAELIWRDWHQLLHANAIEPEQAAWCPAEVIFGDSSSVKLMLLGALLQRRAALPRPMPLRPSSGRTTSLRAP